MKSALLAAMLVTFSGLAEAQSARTEHTFRLDDPDARPAATLADASWLVGSWSGPAFGAMAEEVWNPPSAGSMVGMFKVYKEDTVLFYELIIMVEEQGSLAIKVKHFNADFTAWESKEDYVTFRLVEVAEDALHFSGLSFYRITDDELHVYIALNSNGETSEHKLIYLRTDA
ncbi:MAG: DUF6265 family protein [Pseudomonadota bacterium]